MNGKPEFMELALREAARGRGRTHPNPMVGCVVVRAGEVIAKGYHARAGAPHAEAMALKRAGKAARGSDLYVTLEPCNHFGRTPPCTDAIIEAGVKRVFVGMRDPHDIVDGRGIRRLRRAGIEVAIGLLRDECVRLNEAYKHFVKTKQPFVVAKMAQSLDGRVATHAGHSKWITSEKARKFGHMLRRDADGIVVGVGTVLADDPELTCRMRGGVDPIRIVLDTQARTPPKAKVVKVGASSTAPTWIVVGKNAPADRVGALEAAGATIVRCRVRDGRIRFDDFLAEIAKREILSILVEGGPTILGSFFDARLVNKVHSFVAPMIIGGVDAKPSVGGKGARRLAEAAGLNQVSVERVGPDFMIVGYCS